MDTPFPDEQYRKKLTSLDSQRNIYAIDEDEYQNKRALLLPPNGGYVFDTDEDIISVVDYLVAQSKDTNIFPVRYVSDPKRMIQLGLWPTSVDMAYPWVAGWLAGEDIDVLEFWTTDTSPRVTVIDLHDEMNWIYKTMQTLQKEAVEKGNSIALKMYAPEMLYRSNRPVTDMSLFRSPLSYTCRRSDVIRNRLVVNKEVHRVIPVTRYAQGMSKGLYYGDEDTPSDVCGTFYYNEEESNTLLAYKTELRAFNKTDACMKLGIVMREDARRGDTALRIDYGVQKHMNGIYPLDLMLTPQQALDYMGHRDSEDIHTDLPNAPHYAAEYLDLYSAEDYLDQPLCNAARDAGYDIVVLENMVGSFQIVTEVLDTRSREESFRSLVYVR